MAFADLFSTNNNSNGNNSYTALGLGLTDSADFSGLTNVMNNRNNNNILPFKNKSGTNANAKTGDNFMSNMFTGINALSALGSGLASILSARANAKYQKKMANLYEGEYNRNINKENKAQANYESVYGDK